MAILAKAIARLPLTLAIALNMQNIDQLESLIGEMFAKNMSVVKKEAQRKENPGREKPPMPPGPFPLVVSTEFL
ncbi:hypothetical protein B0H63DRAFT_526778 [Podospora didyma]|uniref:Uncharacterized protein n=1 Tax=Podospora didyma TaxID=330526 RepID=A0AAE0N5X7_9PEZI|nr:hypothetical protein B0H63DRAFT_526778 [Podospora didyma]